MIVSEDALFDNSFYLTIIIWCLKPFINYLFKVEIRKECLTIIIDLTPDLKPVDRANAS